MISPTERGLFERIEFYLGPAFTRAHGRQLAKEACEHIEQQLAEAEKKASLVDLAKEFDSAADDAEWEPPHPIFQLAEERDSYMFQLKDAFKKIEWLEHLIAEMGSKSIIVKGAKTITFSEFKEDYCNPQGYDIEGAIKEMEQDKARIKQLEGVMAEKEQQLAAAREEVEGLRADAKRYQILKDDYIEYKPAGYDGCSFGRFDLCWKSDTSDLSKAIDAALTAPLPEKNDHE
jgi:DNA repair exonuclease SbcCD ATPase subunit